MDEMMNRVNELITLCTEFRTTGTLGGQDPNHARGEKALIAVMGKTLIIWDRVTGILVSQPEAGVPIVYLHERTDPEARELLVDELERPGHALIGRML